MADGTGVGAAEARVSSTNVKDKARIPNGKARFSSFMASHRYHNREENPISLVKGRFGSSHDEKNRSFTHPSIETAVQIDTSSSSPKIETPSQIRDDDENVNQQRARWEGLAFTYCS